LLNSSDSSINKGKIIDFPQLWQDITVDTLTLPSYGYSTYRATVLLPDTSAPLSINMPDVYSSYSLYINLELVLTNGKVADNAKDSIPHWQVKTYDIPVCTTVLHIALQVSNFIHSKGGIKESIIIGEKEILSLKKERANAIDLLLTGCLFMGGLFFIGLYLFGRRDKAILLFALFSIVYSYRIIGTENYVLHTLLPDLNWTLTLRLE